MQRKFLILCIAALLCMTTLIAPVAAATTTETFQADADTSIRSGAGGTNYGTNQALAIQRATNGGLDRSLIRFDFPSIPEGVTIESATLYGYMSAKTGDGEVAAYRVASAWTETGVTWNTRPSNATQPTSITDPGPTANVWIGCNVTRDVQAYVLGAPNYGWLLAFSDESTPLTRQVIQLRSKDYSNSALRPYLNVTYSTDVFTPILTTIEISPATANLAAGGTQQFVATAKDHIGNEMTGVTFDWSSSNETVGTVDETGLFTPLAKGTTTVTADTGDVNGTAQVTVTVPAVTTIEVSPATANLFVGTAQQFSATAKDQDGNEMAGITFDWSSSNETVGTVNATGFFTALDIGTATITASAENVSGSVTVAASIPASDLTITNGPLPCPAVAVFCREPNVVWMVVKNNGPETATDIMVAIYASDVPEVPVNITTPIASLAGGAQTTIYVLDPTIREHDGGTVTYTAVLDPENTIVETSETNNVAVGGARDLRYNGYKGKMYWDGGSNVTTVRTYDLRGDIVHSLGDSQYMSGSGKWLNYTVTWTAGDLPLPEGATVRDAWLYVPYCWDNSNLAPDNVSIDFNGVRVSYVNWYHDKANFGMYGNHAYGLMTYNVTDLYEASVNNTALFARESTGAISPAGFTLAVIYEDASATRKQIFVNEEFDILGADQSNYGTNMPEATAYVPFSGMTIKKEDVIRANLTTIVPWGDSGEGNLFFNGEQIGTGVWNYGPRAVGASDTPQVAVDEREVTAYLNATGNEAAIQGDETLKSPVMVAGQTFLVVEYADDTAAPAANFMANVTSGDAPLAVQFTDTSTGSPTSWLWDFGDNETSDQQNATHTYTTAGTYTVNLTVANAAGSDSEVKTGYITVTSGGSGEAPVAAFTATPMNGLAPLSVTFTDASTSSPTAWSWESRPSGTDENWTAFSTEQNATYNFAAGAYDIRLTVNNADGSDTATKTQFISSSAGAKRLATVQNGSVSGDLYVGAYGGFGSGTSYTTNTFNQTFTLPTYTDVQWARLYTVVYAAGTDNRTGTATVKFDGDGDGTYDTLGIETLATAGDNTVNVYPVNDHVNRQYSDYLLWYDVTDLVGSQSPEAEVVSTPVESNFDGRIKELVLVVAYNDGDGDEVYYWVNDGHDYQANGAGGVTSTFATGGKPAGWTDTTLRNVMLSSRDAQYTFNGAAYTGVTPSGYFGTNAWDVRNNLTAGSDSSFTYVPNGGSYKTTLATLAVKYPGLDAPVADFTANVTAGEAPLAMQFTDLSTGSPTTWAWDFENDGIVDSADQNPAWTYASAGTYTVNLTATNAAGSDTEVKTDYITVTGGGSGGDAPVADFTADMTSGEAPLAVQFTDTSTGSPTTWAWDFGDNATGDQQNPVHTFTEAGTYSINLTVSNDHGSDTEIKTDYITVTAPSGGDAPDLAVSTLAPNNGEVFSASENIYAAKVTNIGTGDAGAFSVGFNVSGVTGTVAVDGLAAGANTTVTWTDETVREAGDNVTATATADADDAIDESDEENNLLTVEKTVVHNGYRGMRWTDGEDIVTAATYDVRGDLLWSPGDGAYLSASTNWANYTVAWTANDLAVPANATIDGARLYVPYTYDKGPVFAENVTLAFNDVIVDPVAFYEDEKGWGTSYPYGMTVYNVTDQFSADGNSALLTNTFPGGGKVSVRGMLLAVVYDDGTTAPHTVIMNEGFDLLYGGAAQGTTPEQATAYAPFTGTLDTANVVGATLITVAPGAGPTEGDLLFNNEIIENVWNYTGTSQIGVDKRNVTALLLPGENTAAFRSDADWMEAAAAFLVVEYAPEPGSIAVISTPTGAAVWLDGADTGLLTDCTLTDVPAGEHVVTLKLDGYADASTPVTVRSGETTEITLELTTLTSNLTVTSTPAGAAIFIDGADTGEVTNATLDGVGVGEHVVTLKLDGYADATAEVTIVENEAATLHLDLIEAHGSIAVTSMPDGAAIFLDDIETGKLTNALLENVPAGTHTVTVKKVGYADASMTVTVADDETTVASFTLTEPAGSIVVTSTPDGATIFLDGTETGEVTNATLTNVPIGEHTVRVTLDGYLDAEEAVTVASGEIAAVHFDLTRASITLQPGWNFVSTPKRLAAGQDTIAIFDDVETDGRPILFYNGTCQWDDLSREDAFRPLDGIWIYANGTYEIPLAFAAGSNSPPPTKYLDEGWNTIGFTDTVPEPAVTTLRSVETTWANLWGWKADEQAYDVSIIRGATGRHGEARELSPFQGYWLYMNDADTLTAIGA